MKVVAGPSRVSFELEVATFRWPRCGARLMISSRSCYEVLGLSQFGGQQWRRVAGSFRRWQAHLGQLGLAEHVVVTGTMEASVGAYFSHLHICVWLIPTSLCCVICLCVKRLGQPSMRGDPQSMYGTR